jgi:hypothetical protein
MSASRNACRTSEAAALADLSGVEFQHDVHLALRDWRGWTTVSERFSCAGVDVVAVQLARSGGGFDVRCRLTQVSAQSARELINTLLDDGIAERGSIEHLVLAKRSVEAPR